MKGNWLEGLMGMAAAVPCWWLSVTLLRAWLTPMAVDNGRWVKLGVGIMVLEFLLVHSGFMIMGLDFLLVHSGFMVKAVSAGAFKRMPFLVRSRLFLAVVLTAIYALFAVAISLAFQSSTIFWIFSGIMISRWAGIFFDPDNAKAQQLSRSVVSVVLYLGVVFLTVAVEFPAGGLSPSVVNTVYPERGDGIWEEAPQQALAAGVIYFFILGLFELGRSLRAIRSN